MKKATIYYRVLPSNSMYSVGKEMHYRMGVSCKVNSQMTLSLLRPGHKLFNLALPAMLPLGLSS